MATTNIGVSCTLCGALARVDEHERCEQCVMDAERIAAGLLERLGWCVADARESGLSEAQLREAFEMTLADADGPLTGTILARHATEGIWLVEPSSVFIDRSDPPPKPNEIARLRYSAGWSIERLADRIGVPPTELALWEAGKLPPRRFAIGLADLFAVSLDHLLGVSRIGFEIVDGKPMSDKLKCARCGEHAPGGQQRYEQGWDVAGGTELVCADCLTPADLEWPSDAEAAA